MKIHIQKSTEKNGLQYAHYVQGMNEWGSSVMQQSSTFCLYLFMMSTLQWEKNDLIRPCCSHPNSHDWGFVLDSNSPAQTPSRKTVINTKLTKTILPFHQPNWRGKTEP